MYGLFYYSYDWYEWEELIAVSENKKLLEKKYKSEAAKKSHDLDGNPQRLIDGDEHKKISVGRSEEYHYCIQGIEYLK